MENAGALDPVHTRKVGHKGRACSRSKKVARLLGIDPHRRSVGLAGSSGIVGAGLCPRLGFSSAANYVFSAGGFQTDCCTFMTTLYGHIDSVNDGDS